MKRGSGDLPDLSRVPADVFTALRDRERRYVLYYLLEHRSASVEELADVVTGWSHAGTHGMADRADWDQVQARLSNVHLSQLAESGLVEYDEVAGWVRLTIATPEVTEVIRWAFVRDGSGGPR